MIRSLFLVCALLGAAACHSNDHPAEGPLERAGRATDDAAHATKEGAKAAGHETKCAAKNANDDTKDQPRDPSCK